MGVLGQEGSQGVGVGVAILFENFPPLCGKDLLLALPVFNGFVIDV
jgi:hypothetical protein